MLRRGAFGWRQLEFVGTGNADYQDFVLPDRQAAARSPRSARSCAANWWRWDRLALGNIPGHSSTLAHLTAASDRRGMHLVDEAR